MHVAADTNEIILTIKLNFLSCYELVLMLSLHAEMSFEGAEGNIQKLLDRNKKLFYQLPTDALDGIITADSFKLVIKQLHK